MDRHEANKTQIVEQAKTVQDLGPFDEDLARFTNIQAQKKFEQREPLLAAAIHLSLNDTRRAVQKLLLANELEHAFVLAKAFDQGSLDYILTRLFLRSQPFK